MAYQNPSYCFLHAAADAGAASITINGAYNADYPEDNLIDYRPSSLLKWTATATPHRVVIDRGAGTREEIDRMIIPSGHNMAGEAWELRTNTSDSWGGTTVASGTFAAGLVDEVVSGGTEAQRKYQWVRLAMSTGGTALEMGQLFLTHTRTPTTRGIEPHWEARQVPTLTEIPFPSRSALLSLAQNRWLYRVSYERLESTDLAVFDNLMTETGGGLVPFYFIPPDDGDDALLMRIQDFTRRRQARQSPSASGAAFTIDFSMIEQIG